MKARARFISLIFLALLALTAAGCRGDFNRHYEKGLALFQEGKTEQAIDEYEKALKIQPENVEALYAAGWARLTVGQTENAMVYFSRCIKFNDRFYGGYKGMGSLYASLGQTAQAEENFKKALEFDPKNASIYGNLGDLYRNTNRFDEAEAAYQKGQALLPEFADIQNGMIGLRLAQKQYDEAIALAEKAITRPYRQKILKAQTYHWMANAYFEKAQLETNAEQKTQLFKKAEEALNEGEKILRDPRQFQDLRQLIATAKDHPQPPPAKKKAHATKR